MIDFELSSKRYHQHDIDLNNKNLSHTIMVELTGYNKNVLEIGTSTGYISKILKEHNNKITGIEIDSEAGLIAQNFCDQIIIGDIEILDLDNIFKPASFDVILCGDILEHLKSPDVLLRRIQKFLKPHGYLVVSLPNFCHGDVLINLIQGDFHYTSMGLLDKTHLRFFGLKNIYSCFSECGYQITDLRTTKVDIGNTELKLYQEKMPYDLSNFIRSLPNSDVYQFIFTAFPSSNITIPDFNNYDLKELFINSLSESKIAFQTPLLDMIEAEKTTINQLNLEISNFKSSISYRLFSGFHDKITKPLFLLSTKNRKIFSLGLSYGRFIFNEGFVRIKIGYRRILSLKNIKKR